MAVLIPLAIAAASAASGGTGFYFWNKAKQTKAAEIEAARIIAEKIEAERIEAMKMKIKIDNLKAEIVEITNQYNVRVIVVGHRGSGKSSLINTFKSAMEDKRVYTAVSRTAAETISQCYSDYYIEDEKKGSKIITLLDTGGLPVGNDNDDGLHRTSGNDNNDQTKKDYYIEENGSKLIPLLDTSGLPVGKHETSVNDNNDQTQNLLENIRRAIEGKLPYDTNMLEEPKTDSETTEPITIVLFVYNAQVIIGEKMKTFNDTVKSLQIEVAKMNVASMLVLTHTDCINEKTQETVREEANRKLGFNKGDILLIKCLVDLQADTRTSIPLEDRLQALEVLYKVTYDGAEKIKMVESRKRNR